MRHVMMMLPSIKIANIAKFTQVGTFLQHRRLPSNDKRSTSPPHVTVVPNAAAVIIRPTPADSQNVNRERCRRKPMQMHYLTSPCATDVARRTLPNTN